MINKRILKRCFGYRGKRFYMNVKMVPEYIRETRFLKKHGYDISAQWATCAWFVEVMKEILKYHRYQGHGAPMLLPLNDSYKYSEEQLELNEQMWHSELDKMIALLDEMDENNPKYDKMDSEESLNNMNKAKDEFFTLFSKYFYKLWD